MARRKVTDQKSIADMLPIPFRGGCNTYLPAITLPSGSFSMIQNMRATHPGFKSRSGMLKLYATAHSATKVLSIYNFSKGKRSEKHFLAQYSDGDVYEGTNAPPAVSTGDFGTLKFSGNASAYPASWSVIDDTLIQSNGLDQHQLYPGDQNPIRSFTVYQAAATLPLIPDVGNDYTMEVLDSSVTTYAVISALENTAGDCILICCPCVPSKLTFTMLTANAIVSNLSVDYWNNAWTTVTALSDGTSTPAAATIFSDTMSATTNWTASDSTLLIPTALSYSDDMSVTTGWTAVNATLTSVAGGQAGNMLTVAESGGANPGQAYHDITTVIGQTYWFSCYFKKGTSANGKILIGETGDTDLIYDSGNLSDADWALKETVFTATATTTRISLLTNDATAGETSLFDTLSCSAEGTCLQIAETGGANAGKAYKDITTVVGQKYLLRCYFKKGTSANGKIMIGTTSDEDSLYDSGNLTDTSWALKEYQFTATATTTRITLQTNDATAGETSLFDTVSVITGVTFAQSGTISWTQPTDHVPSYMFGISGFWVRLSVSAELSATVTVSQVTYGAGFQPVQNVWDGEGITVLEARFYIATSAAYFTYYGSSIDISSMVATNDAVYFNTIDLMNAFYIDSTSTPSKTASVTPHLYYWSGSVWTEVSGLVDNTSGFTKPGWVTFTKTTAQKTMFQTSYYSYWWKLTVTGGNISADTRIGIYTMPYYDINEIMTAGRCSSAWKNRAVYSTDRDQYLIVSALHQPMCLNGNDSAVLDPGDGRANLPICMKQFKNELMVWQEEKGTEGGCFTLFEGYNPDTFGKLVLSTKLGALNAKSAVVVEGVEVSTETGVEIRTVVYVLSHYGVYASDGRYCTIISDNIRDRFDTTNANCIRRGYESDMWIAYDSTSNVLKLGLVCGTATVPNVFPVYDISDSAWMFDTGQGLSSVCEVEAGTGTAPVLLCGGGSADGLIHLLNYGTMDNGVAIDAYATMELDGGGLIMNLREMILLKTGNVTITPSQDGTAQTAKVI